MVGAREGPLVSVLGLDEHRGGGAETRPVTLRDLPPLRLSETPQHGRAEFPGGNCGGFPELTPDLGSLSICLLEGHSRILERSRQNAAQKRDLGTPLGVDD
jgi:hypothetical protein